MIHALLGNIRVFSFFFLIPELLPKTLTNQLYFTLLSFRFLLIPLQLVACLIVFPATYFKF